MRDMDPNPCALESTGLELSNARGFKSKFVTVAIISWLEHEWFWKKREFQRNFLPWSLFLREQAKYQKYESEAVCVSKIKISMFERTQTPIQNYSSHGYILSGTCTFFWKLWFWTAIYTILNILQWHRRMCMIWIWILVRRTLQDLNLLTHLDWKHIFAWPWIYLGITAQNCLDNFCVFSDFGDISWKFPKSWIFNPTFWSNRKRYWFDSLCVGYLKVWSFRRTKFRTHIM